MAPIIRRKQLTAPPPADQEAERSSILKDAAGAAMTGLHTVGSALSFPSRVVWGTANAIAGGPGGFGNLNPFDSTGGIEASQFLANQGLISQNDPTKWELGDFGRGGVDLLGDPTSWGGIGTLTKSGQALSKAGRLTGTAAQQIGRGERALLGLQVPFSAKSVGMIGTGQRAARLAEGAANIGRRVADARIPGTQVSPVRWLTSKFDWRKLGMRTPETQAQAPRFAQQRLDSWRGNAEFLQGVARNWQQAGMDTPKWQRSLGMARELGLTIEVPVEKAGGIKLYHASPADIRGPLKPSPGRAANEPVGIFFATSEPESMRSTGKQSSRIYERIATPKKTIDMASGEYHRMAMDANREAVAAAKNRPEFSGIADDEILSILADTEGSPQSILTSKLTQKGYDSAISRGAGADGEDWFVALKPDIVSGEQMRRLTPADGPDFWNHLDPTGGLAQIDDYLKQTSARRQMKGISRTRDLVDIVQHDADEDGVLEALNNALLATNSRMKPENAEKLAGKLAEDWSESNITQGYLPRYMRPDVRKELDRGSFKGQGAMSVESPISMQRQELLKGVRGGRSMIDSIVQDSDADALIRDLAARADSPEQADLQQQISEMMDEYNALEADGAEPDDLEALGADIADLQSQVLDRENVLGQVEELLQSKYGDYVVPTFNDPVERGSERSRLRVMSEWMVNHPELRQNGVYGADVIGDLWRYADNASTSENAFDFMADTVSRYSQPGRAVDRPTVDDAKFVKVGSLLAKLGAHTNEAARYIGGLLGETSGEVLERTVPKHIADDLTNLGEAIRPVKDAELGRNAFQKFMSAWKAGALSWPRRVIRDRMSGIVRNVEQGMFSGKAFLDAEHLYRGRTLRGYERIPAVQQWIQEYGLEPTEEGATEAIRRKFGSYMASNPGIFTDLSDATGSGTAGGIDQLLSAMPGAIPESFGQAAQRGVRETFSNFSKWGDIPGVKDVPEATAGPVRAAQQLSEYTDYLNRSEAFLEQLRQGESDLPTIFNRIDSAQVNYDPRRSAPADRVMKNLMPFWRFMSRQLPFTLAELAMNPGGRLAQGIKAVDRGMEADPSLPDAALSGTAVPLGTSPDGTKAFLTGFGLMHETPVELLGQAGSGDFRSLGYGLAGQMNPLIQKPVEYVTGQSMFREGEKLSDLDPTVGRLISNVGESLGLMPAGSQPVNVPYGPTIDMGISLIPGLGPLATQIRTATDPRRGALEKGVQLATGARTLRQSPKAQRRVLRRRLEQLAEDEGGSLGSHLYARPGAVERNPRLGEIIALSRALERESAADRQPKRRRVLTPSSAR